MQKKTGELLFAGLFFFLLAGSATAADRDLFIASNYSDRYHIASCKITSKIYADERVTFKSKEEAAHAGYSPCKKCHPKEVSQNFS